VGKKLIQPGPGIGNAIAFGSKTSELSCDSKVAVKSRWQKKKRVSKAI